MGNETGYRFRDELTGFEGVCVGHVTYLTGCDQLLLQPKSEKGDSRPASEWFDLNRLTRMDAPRVSFDVGPKPGADRAAPSK